MYALEHEALSAARVLYDIFIYYSKTKIAFSSYEQIVSSSVIEYVSTPHTPP